MNIKEKNVYIPNHRNNDSFVKKAERVLLSSGWNRKNIFKTIDTFCKIDAIIFPAGWVKSDYYMADYSYAIKSNMIIIELCGDTIKLTDNYKED